MPDQQTEPTSPLDRFWHIAEGDRISKLHDIVYVYPGNKATDAERAAAWRELAGMFAELATLAATIGAEGDSPDGGRVDAVAYYGRASGLAARLCEQLGMAHTDALRAALVATSMLAPPQPVSRNPHGPGHHPCGFCDAVRGTGRPGPT